MLHVQAGYEGARHDLEIFRSTIPDIRIIMEAHPRMPQKVLGDKGYQCHDIDFLLTPHKGSIDNLSRQQLQFNDRIGKSRIIIENFFGRLKSKFAIIGSKFRGDHKNYENIFTLCCALVNFEIRECGHGLRKEDGDFYRKHMTQVHQMVAELTSSLQVVRRSQRSFRMQRIFDITPPN